MTISIKRDADTFEVPDKLPCLPLRDVVIYPFVVMPLLVGRAASLAAIEAAGSGPDDRFIFLVAQRNSELQDPGASDLYRVGVIGRLLQLTRLPNGTTKVLIEGIARAKVSRYSTSGGAIRASVV